MAGKSSGAGGGGGSGTATASSGLDDAQRFAEDNLALSVYINRDDNVDPRIMNEVNDHIQQRLRQWEKQLSPMTINGKLESIEVLNSSQLSGFEGAFAAVGTNTSALYIDSRSLNRKSINESHQASKDFANAPGNTDRLPFVGVSHFNKRHAAKYYIDHELGHVVHFGMNSTSKSRFDRLVTAAEKKGWKPVSHYSKSDRDERFAEIFAVHAGGRKDLLPDSVNKFLDDLMR
jgi:hypothetical protein